MEYKITDESKAEAVRVFEKKFGMIPEYTASAFAAALEALCVPVDDGWRPMSGKPYTSFQKGSYRLLYDHGGWRLYHIGGQWPIISTGPLMDADKAKCWADEQIAFHEFHRNKHPKPFGPSTRLRAANGDELLIVGNVSCQDVMVVNLTADAAIVLPDSCYWHSPEFTESWLACSGATVIG